MFMRRVAYYYLRTGDDAGWDNLVAAGRDDQSETAEYLTGWQDTKERMFREVQNGLRWLRNPASYDGHAQGHQKPQWTTRLIDRLVPLA